MVKPLRELICTNGLDCPKVYPPLDDGRVPVQGDKADDALRAELGIPPHEDVVLTSTAVLSDVRDVLTLEELSKFVSERHRHDLFRFESLLHYSSDSDEEDFKRWLRGDSAPAAHTKQAWLNRIRCDTVDGKRWRRVRAVTDLISPYAAYQVEWGYPDLLAAGEQIRMKLLTPTLARVGDFFVLDGEHVVRSCYNFAGRFTRAEVMHADSIAPYVALADLLWDQSHLFSQWLVEHPDHLKRICNQVS